MKVETTDPWSFVRDRDVFGSVPRPRTKATMSISTAQGLRVGWNLFWRSLLWKLTRRGSITFWMEDDSE